MRLHCVQVVRPQRYLYCYPARREFEIFRLPNLWVFRLVPIRCNLLTCGDPCSVRPSGATCKAGATEGHSFAAGGREARIAVTSLSPLLPCYGGRFPLTNMLKMDFTHNKPHGIDSFRATHNQRKTMYWCKGALRHLARSQSDNDHRCQVQNHINVTKPQLFDSESDGGFRVFEFFGAWGPGAMKSTVNQFLLARQQLSI